RVPDEAAGDEARQVLAPRPGARDTAAEHEREQQERERRHRQEADEEKRAHAQRVEQVFDEREVHAPQAHGEQRGDERPAAGGHQLFLVTLRGTSTVPSFPNLKFETPLTARAAVRALAPSKIRELYNT